MYGVFKNGDWRQSVEDLPAAERIAQKLAVEAPGSTVDVTEESTGEVLESFREYEEVA